MQKTDLIFLAHSAYCAQCLFVKGCQGRCADVGNSGFQLLCVSLWFARAASAAEALVDTATEPACSALKLRGLRAVYYCYGVGPARPFPTPLFA